MIYKLTKNFPISEKYGLVDQLRRASISISSNIAEGFSRRSSLEKKQFYYQSLGSLTEVQNQLLVYPSYSGPDLIGSGLVHSTLLRTNPELAEGLDGFIPKNSAAKLSLFGIARDVGYTTKEVFNQAADQTVTVGKLIHSLIEAFPRPYGRGIYKCASSELKPAEAENCLCISRSYDRGIPRRRVKYVKTHP